MNTSTLVDSTTESDIRKIKRLGDQSIISSHLINLYSQLATLEQQGDNTSRIDSKRSKSLQDSHQHDYLYLRARYKIEEERIESRYDMETRSTKAYFASKKAELKEHLLDRLRRKRKLLVDEMRSSIDINSRSFDIDPLFVTMQAPHPLQTKAYNFRQRSDIPPQASGIGDDEYLSQIGILQQPTTRKRLVGAFSIFQLPKWTIKDEECENDLRMIMNNRR